MSPVCNRRKTVLELKHYDDSEFWGVETILTAVYFHFVKRLIRIQIEFIRVICVKFYFTYLMEKTLGDRKKNVILLLKILFAYLFSCTGIPD